MPFTPEKGFFQADSTKVDPTPDGDSVKEGFVQRNTPAITQIYQDLNLLRKSGGAGLPDGVTIVAKDGVWSVAPGALVPKGVITLWSGAVNAIPAGWALCNGTNGTPDLRNRFVVGAGEAYGVGTKGGVAFHAHSADFLVDNTTLAEWQMPSHAHQYACYANSGDVGGAGHASGPIMYNASTLGTGGSGGHSHHGSLGTSDADNRPPYYALAYIMKL